LKSSANGADQISADGERYDLNAITRPQISSVAAVHIGAILRIIHRMVNFSRFPDKHEG
jgi:hypothetical protein